MNSPGREAADPDVFSVPIRVISKHGNVKLDTSFDEMKAHDMEVGDIITVFVGDDAFDMPIGTNFTDVDTGEMVCLFDAEDNEIELAINMGSFAETAGIGDNSGFHGEIGLSLKEKQGYRDIYDARNLSRSNNREDYPELTDEEFANFRAFCVESTKEPVFYRSSSPINPEIGRNEYAMAAMEAAGIRTVIDLADSVEDMEGFSTYPGSYYSRCKVFNPELGYDFGSEDFAAKIKDIITFILENDGPYLIHCKEGKDRTGVLCALLEYFAGESTDAVEKDYMLTFYNFYHVLPGDKAYDIILDTNLVRTMCSLCQTDDLKTADMKEEVREYFLSIGLTEEQLDQLAEKLQS